MTQTTELSWFDFETCADDYHAFPLRPLAPATDETRRKSEASLAALRDGGFLLAYAAHVGRSDNDRAPLVGLNLDSQGNPAGEERVIAPPPQGGFNAMSPALQRLPDGRIGMVFSHRESKTEASRKFVASDDEGVSWSEPVTVAEGEYKTGCHDRFAIHSTGRFLAPLHCSEDFDKHYMHVRVARSDDAGKSWTLGPAVELPYVGWPEGSGGGRVGSGPNEPGIAERSDGSLLMTLRSAMGTQFKAESFDRGETWTSPKSMEVVSPTAPAHLSRIPGTDDLLLVWTPNYEAKAGFMGERHTIAACVSRDGGRSWPHASRRILFHTPNNSLDYPSVLHHKGEVWMTLRQSTGKGVLEGRTSTVLARVPLPWFYGK